MEVCGLLLFWRTLKRLLSEELAQTNLQAGNTGRRDCALVFILVACLYLGLML